MLFNSYIFILVFLPIVVGIYYAMESSNEHKLKMIWLVCSSLTFYAFWNYIYLTLLVGSVCANYLIGRLLTISFGREEVGPMVRKIGLVSGIALNLGLIGYYKYYNFFIEIATDSLGLEGKRTDIVLPLAISFFTFQQIAFLVDTYRGRVAESSFIHYSLFVTFFPQLIAGPIVHHQEVLPQFRRRRPEGWDQRMFLGGLVMFSVGLFKKVNFADSLAVYSNRVFLSAGDGNAVGFYEAWVGALA